MTSRPRPRFTRFRLFARRGAKPPRSALDLAGFSETPVESEAIEASADRGVDVDGEEAATHADVDVDDSATAEAATPGLRVGLMFVLLVIAAVAGLLGWTGFQAYATVQEQRQHARFLEAGREAAIKLTTISYTDADGDVRRILDSAIGPFSDDFQKRSQPFIDMVKQVQSSTVGTVAEAGLQSVDGDRAQVVVAVSVKTTLGAGGEQPLRLWRMRIEVQNVGHDTKVSNVEFVQ